MEHRLVVMTDVANTQVQVDLPAVCVPSTIAATIHPLNPLTVNVCPAAVQLCAGGVQGIRVRALSPGGDILHVAAEFSVPNNLSDDSWLVLPASRLLSAYRAISYTSAPWPQIPALQLWTAVAAEPGVTLDYTDCGGGLASIVLPTAGSTFQLLCDSNSLFCGTAPRELTGDLVAARDSKKVAFTSGHWCVEKPPGKKACDAHAESVWPIPPNGALYHDYLLSEFNNDDDPPPKGDRFRILAIDPQVQVFMQGVGLVVPDFTFGRLCTNPITLTAGPWCDVSIDDGGRIFSPAEAKFLVTQFMRGAEVTLVGDPSSLHLVPRERFTCEHRFFSWPGFERSTPPSRTYGSYINVIGPSAALASTLITGSAWPATTLPFACQDGFSPVAIGATGYSWVECRLPNPPAAGTEWLVQGRDASGGPVRLGVYVYGQMSYQAYAYPANIAFHVQ